MKVELTLEEYHRLQKADVKWREVRKGNSTAIEYVQIPALGAGTHAVDVMPTGTIKRAVGRVWAARLRTMESMRLRSIDMREQRYHANNKLRHEELAHRETQQQLGACMAVIAILVLGIVYLWGGSYGHLRTTCSLRSTAVTRHWE